MADIGYSALLVAILASVYSAIAFAYGGKTGRPDLIQSAKHGVIAVFGLMSVAMIVMIIALVTRDFRLEYVAAYTDRELSLAYTLSAVWAGSRGSLLFWAWVLSLFAMIMVAQKRDVGKELIPYAASVTMLTQVFFLVLLLSVSNPFIRLPFTPADGRGLNPLLENPGMFLHPPTQLIGYVGFTIPFALAMAALLTGSLGDNWIIAARRWAIISWLILGIGNLAGSWWAYFVLGWGGHWAWDPVENAGLLPWLVGTAFLHSAMMQRRRGILKRWNMVLVILTFVLSIFGTFLTRSGILASVHSFSETALGPFFLAFIWITLAGSLILLWYRSAALKSEAEIESTVSRESTFLINNLLLVTATFAVFLGTVFPVISEWVRGVKITVGPPFYNQVMVPIFLATIFLTGICTMIGWRRASVNNLVRNFVWPSAASVWVAIALFAAGVREWTALVGISLCDFVLFTIFYEWFRGTRARHHSHAENYLKAFFGLLFANRPRYGGYIVHMGIVILAIGTIGMSVYDTSKEVTLKSGESATIDRFILTYKGLDRVETESRLVYTTALEVRNRGELIGYLTAQKYFHRNHDTPVTVAAVRSTLREDLYAILIGWEEDGSASFKLLVNPLVNWIWIGGGIVIFGGLFAFWPDRQKPLAPARKAAEERL
ncbi:MAG: heme lyase CcmF/NrfE family subunit [Chloroflexi bacterium]|nr:heme lyase CcmF/NrfE family subunit [Chloroflexota bacterium]